MKSPKLSLAICFLLFSASTARGASLTHGPLIGNVTPTSATVFVRTDAATSNGFVRVLCCISPLDTPFSTSAATDFTAQVPLSGFVPGISYTIQIFVDGVLQSPTGTLRMFPAATSPSPFTFVVLTDFAMGPSGTTCSSGGFNACPDLVSSTFTNADAENPAFVILGGDFDHRNPATYDDADCSSGTRYQKRVCKYEKMWKDLYTCTNWGTSDLCGHVLRKYPLVHAWDDHDYSSDNSDGMYEDKMLAYDKFARYLPSYPLLACTNSCAGIWQKFSYAYADFFVLDVRSQRSASSMLAGYVIQPPTLEDQLTWLKNGLLNSTATWKFIWSSVVFNKTLQKTDSWYGFPVERDSLVAWINGSNPQQKVIKNVIVLSGDLHAGALDDGVSGFGQLPEMLSPAVNFTTGSPQHCQSVPNSGRGNWSNGMYTTGSAGTTPCNGYGVVSVSPNVVTLTIKDSNGDTINLDCVPQGTVPCVSPHLHITPLTIPAQ